MKRLKNILYIAFFATVTSSCNDDFVNTGPLNEIPAEAVWSDGPLAEAFVYEIYNGFGMGGFYEQQKASMTDEALFTHPGRGINTVTESRSNDVDQGFIMETYRYDLMYTRIRAANIAIQNLRDPKFDNKVLSDRLLGESYFLRAYFYHQLVRLYGAVPLVTTVYTLQSENYMAPRNTFEECVDFIVANCDSAIMLLEGKPKLDGRTNMTAAQALKARILLYAASDLYDRSTASAKSSLLAGYEHPEFISYTAGDRAERWKKAKEAAKVVIEQSEFAYKLDLEQAATAAGGRANYHAIAMGGGSATADALARRDMILGRFFIDMKDEAGTYVGRNNGPNGYHNWAGNTPIQHLVDDYEMLDGTRFSWDNPQHRASPYDNRDPRFYATILYDGADWKPRTADVAGRDPNNQIQTGRYEVLNADGSKVIHFGLDTRDSPVENWNGSHTGYYYRKFTDANPAIVDQNMRQQIPWPIFRYTEAILNYAEACIELGEEAEARLWLNKIRFRAGMPAITDSGEDLKRRYRNERRIELAYEEHRFFDARRWMIAPETLGRKVNIISVFGALKPGAQVSRYAYSKANYTYTYTVNELNPGIENRSWNDKMYFFSLHRDEINRNTDLKQNPGY